MTENETEKKVGKESDVAEMEELKSKVEKLNNKIDSTDEKSEQRIEDLETEIKKKRRNLKIIITVLAILLIITVLCFVFYHLQVKPAEEPVVEDIVQDLDLNYYYESFTLFEGKERRITNTQISVILFDIIDGTVEGEEVTTVYISISDSYLNTSKEELLGNFDQPELNRKIVKDEENNNNITIVLRDVIEVNSKYKAIFDIYIDK